MVNNHFPMKTIGLIFSFFLFVLMVNAAPQGSGPDQSTPEGTLQMVFDAAATGALDQLVDLCDPEGENDGDTQQICDAAEDPEEFLEYFSNAQLNGEAEIEGDMARVPFLFGPDGSYEETMVLVKREDKWYLYSF